MAKQFDEAEQQEKQNGLQSHANSAGLNLGLDANIVHESLEKRINWTAYKVYWRSAAFNSDDTRMPVATRAQKRKREPEPTEIQGFPVELVEEIICHIQANLAGRNLELLDTRMPVAPIDDLPLELVEKIACQLDVKDVAKLMMVNKRLYSSYAKNRSIVFGKHVALIGLGLYSAPRNCIQKFVDTEPLKLNATLLRFAKRIKSCDKLEINEVICRTNTMFLNQLKSVNELDFRLYTKEDCQKFLSNFHGSVKKHAKLEIKIDSLEQNQAMKEQLSKFIESQLNGCEKISLTFEFMNCFHVYYEALMKTQVKMNLTWTEPWEFDQIVDWIIKDGIPSKNPEAAIHIVSRSESPRAGDFLSQVQGLEPVDDGKNHLALLSRANELIRENEKNFLSFWSPLANYVFDENSSCFRRRIDSTTSCIYLYGVKIGYQHFLAFYMPCQ